jgi:hypothetical protein
MIAFRDHTVPAYLLLMAMKPPKDSEGLRIIADGMESFGKKKTGEFSRPCQ